MLQKKFSNRSSNVDVIKRFITIPEIERFPFRKKVIRSVLNKSFLFRLKVNCRHNIRKITSYSLNPSTWGKSFCCSPIRPKPVAKRFKSPFWINVSNITFIELPSENHTNTCRLTSLHFIFSKTYLIQLLIKIIIFLSIISTTKSLLIINCLELKIYAISFSRKTFHEWNKMCLNISWKFLYVIIIIVYIYNLENGSEEFIILQSTHTV